MKYVCLVIGVFNTFASFALVYLAAQFSMTDQTLDLFVFNVICALVNISLWFILSFTENCTNLSEMS